MNRSGDGFLQDPVQFQPGEDAQTVGGEFEEGLAGVLFAAPETIKASLDVHTGRS
jgi:hypothetical protein